MNRERELGAANADLNQDLGERRRTEEDLQMTSPQVLEYTGQTLDELKQGICRR
jgi:hypothetical protein